ncbi:MAG: dihydrofolate reductase, partial [Cutibacterium granulosum]
DALDLCDELDITEVHRSPEGSARFPTIDPAVWAETRREPRDGFDFVGYRRVTS